MSRSTETFGSDTRNEDQDNDENGENDAVKISSHKNEGKLTTIMKERNGIFTHRIHETTGDVVYDKQNMYINFYHYNMLVPGRNENYTCLFCDEIVVGTEECRKHVVTEKHEVRLKSQAYVEKFLNDIIRRLPKKTFHCGICNIMIIQKKNVTKHTKNDINHDTLKKFGEACARKQLNLLEDSNIETQQSVEVDIGSDKVLLPQGSWHMYSEFPRKFFCFLCEVDSNIEALQDHLTSSEHLTRLGKCHILPEYGSAVVRTFDQNYHHCGICNSYIYITDIKMHTGNLNHKSLDMCKLSRSEGNDKVLLHKENGDGKKKDMILMKINEIVVVELNEWLIYLDVLSYNTIIKLMDFFHCVSCDRDLREFEPQTHINTTEHQMALKNTEFVDDFPQNFIRKIQRSWTVYAHCAICNVCIAFTTECITKHIETKLHKKESNKNYLTLLRSTLENAQNIQEMKILGQSYKIYLYDYNAWQVIGLWERHYHCCFVCQKVMKAEDIHKHIRDTEHQDHIAKCLVLESYGMHYLKIINWTHYVYCTFCTQKIDFIDIDSHIKSNVHMLKQKLAINLFNVDNEKFSTDLEPDTQNEEMNTINVMNVKYHEASLAIRESSIVSQLNEIRMDRMSQTRKLDEEIEMKQLDSGVFIQQNDTKSQDRGSNVHLQEMEKVKSHLFGSERSESGNSHELNKSLNCEAVESEIDTNITFNQSEDVVLEVSGKRILTTYKALNTIVQNTYCNLCKVYFINDVQKHCDERFHHKNAHKGVSDYPDGSIGRKIYKNVIQCLVCDMVTYNWDVHSQSSGHREKLACATLLANQLIDQQKRQNENSQQPEHVNAPESDTLSVRGINMKILGENRENITEKFFILQIRKAKVLVTYNSWNCIYEEKYACLLCNSNRMNFVVEHITRHCNGNGHRRIMAERTVDSDFVRKLICSKWYCLLCNCLHNKSKIKKHVSSSEHIDNLKVAMVQATNALHFGLKVVIPEQANQENNAVKTQDTQSPQENKSDEIFSNIETSLENDENVLIENGHDTNNFQDIEKPIEHRYHIIPTTSRGYRRAVLSEVNCKPEIRKGTIKTIVVKKEDCTENTLIKDNAEVVNNKINIENASIKNNTLVVVKKESCTENTSIKDNAVVVKNDGYTENISIEDNTLVAVKKVGYHENTSLKNNTANESNDTTTVVHKLFPTVPEDKKCLDENALKHKTKIISINDVDTNNINMEHCHICKSTVPVQFLNEHVESLYHKQMLKLVDVMFERLKNRFFDIPTQINNSVIDSNVKYCSVCNCTLGIEEFPNHNDSVFHTDNERNTKMMYQILNVIEPKDIHFGNNDLQENDPDAPKTVEENTKNSICKSNKIEELEVNNSKNANQTQKVLTADEISDSEIYDKNLPLYDEEATIITDSQVTLHMDNVQLRIDLLSYHCVYFISEYSFWCDLCEVKENGLDIHLKDKKHLKRLREVKFRGFHLIRHLSENYAHCALCHLSLHIKRLKGHLDTERHKTLLTTAWTIPIQDNHGTNMMPENVEDLQNEKGFEWNRKRDTIGLNRKREKPQWNAMEIIDDPFFQPKRSKLEDEAQVASKSNVESTTNTALQQEKATQLIKRDKVYVTGMTNESVRLKVGEKTMSMALRAFHGIFVDTKGELYCVLCEDDPQFCEEHIFSSNHMDRVAGLEFSGVDLIRYIDDFLVHCGLCNLPLNAAKVEDHVLSEVHAKNLKASTLPTSTTLQEDCGRPELIGAVEEQTKILLSEVGCSDVEKQNQTTFFCGICNLEMLWNVEIFIVHHLSSLHKAYMKNPSLVIRLKPGERAVYFCHLCKVDLPSFRHKFLHTKSTKHSACLKYHLKVNADQLQKNFKEMDNKKKNATTTQDK